jgi:hypothetical protein
MTASTTTETRGSLTYPVGGPAGLANVLRVAVGWHDFAATDDEAGDVFRVCSVPAGATVIGGYVQGKDIDTGTEALDIDVGWIANGTEALDADGFGNLGLWSGDAATDVRPEVGIYYNFGGVLLTTGPQTFTNRTQIALTVNTPANALTAGRVTVVAFYVFL